MWAQVLGQGAKRSLAAPRPTFASAVAVIAHSASNPGGLVPCTRYHPWTPISKSSMTCKSPAQAGPAARPNTTPNSDHTANLAFGLSSVK